MRIALVHNHYQYVGGEDQVFAAEGRLLEGHGHVVARHEVHNNAVAGVGKLGLGTAAVWNRSQYRFLRELFHRMKPEVVHVHNTLPLISPAVYYAARAEGAAVVQTLHNYRLFCVNGLFFRDGRVCEKCLGRAAAWPGVLHACYRGSRAASGVVAATVGFHKLMGTYRLQIDAYIALTKFARDKFLTGGLPPEKVHVKPNFVAPDPGEGDGQGNYALYAGRLSEEKGLRSLLAAWERVGERLQLRIVGDGPLARRVAGAATGEVIRWLGPQPRGVVMKLMRRAKVLIFPSTWFETFGMTVAEAMAAGTPVLASDIGGISDLVDDGRTGLLFSPGNPTALADAVFWVISHPMELANMRRAARADFEAKFTGEANYRQLLAIYRRALIIRHKGANGGPVAMT